jgi:DNA-binding PadR family transcriptional regulator
VDWTFWTGTGVFITTIVGLLTLRRTDATRRLRLRTQRVLTVLLDARDALAGYDLRRRVGTSRVSFYALLDDLAARGLVTIELVDVALSSTLGVPSQRYYRLTRAGVVEARRYQRESFDRR